MSIIPGFSSRKTNVFDPLSLEFWDPLDRCPFLKDLIPSPFSVETTARSSHPVSVRVDWSEARDMHVIKADLPGLRKEDLKLEVEDGRVLTITGERKEEEGEEGDTWHMMERGKGRFYRRFEMPRDVKLDEVKAEMENGLLTVVVPKVEEKKPAVKLIQIEG